METPPPPPATPEQDPPDRTLVLGAQAGDPSAFDALLVRYQKRVYAVIYNMTMNHEDTNDLLMETFEKAYQSIGGFKADAGFYTWIYRIAINRTINFLKRRNNNTMLSLDNEDLDLQNSADLIENKTGSDMLKQQSLEELQNKLNESLLKLSEEHRAVVTLSDVEGLSHREIAKIMGCSEGTVKSRLFHAHKKLQTYLRNYMS